jgi:hypothetical protein
MRRNASDRRPPIVCLMALPPPVHGASILNEAVARSEVDATAEIWYRFRSPMERA